MSREIVISNKVAGVGINATPAVIEALTALKKNKNSTLKFEPGEYHFYREGTHKQFFAVTNNTSCDKYIVFPIIDFDGLTIDGEGASFVFHEVTFPFIVHKSKNVTLKNITTGEEYALDYQLSERQRDILLAGSLLDYTRENS